MSVKIIRDYTIDDETFTLGKPEQVSDNVLNIPILFNSLEKDDFAAVQTPKMHFDASEGALPRLLFNQGSNKIKRFYSYVQSFENKVISKLQSQLNTLFNSDNIDANDLFKSSIRFPKSLDSCCYMSVQLSHGFHLFDHSGNKIDQQDLTNPPFKSPKGTFILSCESVSITPIQAYINWKIEQAQLHPPKKQKKVSSKIKSFGIIVDEDPDGAAEPPAPVREADDDRRSSESCPEGDTITISLNELNS